VLTTDAWSFVHVSDIHVGSPRSFRYNPAWKENWETARKQIIDLNPDLLLVGGDLTRDGSLHDYELRAMREDLESLPFPYRAVPGNMDTGNKHTSIPGPIAGRDDLDLCITPGQVDRFSSEFGSLQWSLEHENAVIRGFCDMLVGSGLDEEDEQWEWLEVQEREDVSTHHIWLMHYPPFIDRPDEPNFDIKTSYHEWYFGIDSPGRDRLLIDMEEAGCDLVLCGHVHCRKSHRFDGVRYEVAPSTAFPQWGSRWADGDPGLGFMLYEVGESGIGKRYIPLSRQSGARGYGPGGHPPPEMRDYSLAWEGR
jgi:3',5'-cyclic AMP phosphodiesterase CpdA